MIQQECRKGRRAGRRWLLAFLTLAMVGCSKGTGSVSGRVTYQDQPLPMGTVTFFGPDNSVESATIKPDGTYEITKIPAGPAQITVETTDPGKIPAMQMDASKFGKPNARPAADGRAAPEFRPIPERYKDRERSGLKFDVQSGSNKFDIKLKDEPPQG